MDFLLLLLFKRSLLCQSAFDLRSSLLKGANLVFHKLLKFVLIQTFNLLFLLLNDRLLKKARFDLAKRIFFN
jgi:hypothetical protein